MSEETLDRIKSLIEGNKMILFMKGTPDSPQCGFSAATVDVLRQFPYSYKSVDILANPDIRATLPDYSQWPTFPQLFVDGKLVGGCDIVRELYESGELEKTLKEAFGK